PLFGKVIRVRGSLVGVEEYIMTGRDDVLYEIDERLPALGKISAVGKARCIERQVVEGSVHPRIRIVHEFAGQGIDGDDEDVNGLLPEAGEKLRLDDAVQDDLWDEADARVMEAVEDAEVFRLRGERKGIRCAVG